MKKLLVLCLCLVFFVGCSNASAAVTDENETIVSVGGKKVTKQQVYEILRDQDSGETILSLINNFIVDKEVTLTSEIEAEAKAELDKYVTDLGDDLDMFLEYYGYETVDAYYEKEVLPSTLYAHLPDVYIEENWDKVMEYYYPTTARILETDTADKATAAIEMIKTGSTFEAAVKKYSTSTKELYDGKEHVYSRNDSQDLATLVNEFLRGSTGPTLSGVITNDTKDKFYVVQITGKNPNQYSEQAIEVIKEATDLDAEMMTYYCEKYDLRIYDIHLYEVFKEYYPTYVQE